MSKTRFRFPPCVMNILTEKPYPRHDWEIVNTPEGKPLVDVKDGVHYYHVQCSRCKYRDPRPVYH